jgi:hypothetical protein
MVGPVARSRIRMPKADDDIDDAEPGFGLFSSGNDVLRQSALSTCNNTL